MCNCDKPLHEDALSLAEAAKRMFYMTAGGAYTARHDKQNSHEARVEAMEWWELQKALRSLARHEAAVFHGTLAHDFDW